MGAYGEKGGIPRVVRDCVTYLREAGEISGYTCYRLMYPL